MKVANNKPFDNASYSEEESDETSSETFDKEKFTQEAYTFLVEPNSSNWAFRYSVILVLLVLMNIILTVLETVDGPNHYTGKTEFWCAYPNLPNENTYKILYKIVWSPLCIDAGLRLCLLASIAFFPENEELYETIKEDKLTLAMLISDVCCIIPFLVRNLYLYPQGITIDQGSRVILRLLDLLSSIKIFRAIKEIPVIYVLQVTITKSIPHLILPIFTFLLFNVFFGVIMYFLEPCYNVDTCPWTDLFGACYYSVVTMSTVGYGNQTPNFITGRLIACIIMLYGSLFLSMPLAIIGNEYENISSALLSRQQSEFAMRMTVLDSNSIENSKGKSPAAEGGSRTNSIVPKPATPMVECRNNIINCLKTLRSHYTDAKKMSPPMLMALCEIKGWLMPLLWSMKMAIEALSEIKREVKSRKLSFLRSDTPDFENSDRSGSSALLFRLAEGELNRGDQHGDVNEIPTTQRWSFLQYFGFDVSKSNRSTAVVAPGKSEEEKIESENTPTVVPMPRKNRKKNKIKSLALESFSEADEIASDSDEDDDDDFFSEASTENGSPESNEELRKTDDQDAKTPYPLSQSNSSKLTVVRRAELPVSSPASARPTEVSTGGGGGRNSIREKLISFRSMSSRGAALEIVRKTLNMKNENVEADFMRQLIKIAPEIAHMKNIDGEFANQVNFAMKNPDSWRTKLWLIMDFPSSSKLARFCQIFLIIVVLLSVFIFYSETYPSFAEYGEGSEMCGKVLNIYCTDKRDNYLDPGCFVHDAYGVVTTTKLKYFCDDDDCHGHGTNFGAHHSNVTCDPDRNEGDFLPFENEHELVQHFRPPDFLISRNKMHRIRAVCSRIECHYDARMVADGDYVWLPIEIFTNIIFTCEIILRLLVTHSLRAFFTNAFNIFDILSTIPFYIYMIQAAKDSTVSFAIIASSPDAMILVALKALNVFRIFKTIRHFSATQQIVQAFMKVWKQLVGMIILLVFIVTVFAVMLFEVEQGSACFYGLEDCHVPEDQATMLKFGNRVLIDKNGDVSSFSTVFDGLWYCIVTLTTTGYGDKVPATNVGQIMSIFLILFGIVYLAMPLSAASSSFWKVHQAFMKKTEIVSTAKKQRHISEQNSKQILKMELAMIEISKSINKFLEDIQAPNGGANAAANITSRATMFDRCCTIEETLRNTLERYETDFNLLNEMYTHSLLGNRSNSTQSAK